MEDCEEGGESEVEGVKALNILGIAALEGLARRPEGESQIQMAGGQVSGMRNQHPHCFN